MFSDDSEVQDYRSDDNSSIENSDENDTLVQKDEDVDHQESASAIQFGIDIELLRMLLDMAGALLRTVALRVVGTVRESLSLQMEAEMC